MNVVFEKMKDLIPLKIRLKERVNGEILIVSNKESNIMYLNDTSKDFYNLCNGDRTIEDIFGELLSVYNVTESVLQEDIVKLVRDMQWEYIISLKERKNEGI